MNGEETLEKVVYHEGYQYYKSEGPHIGEIRAIFYKNGRWIIDTYYERTFHLYDTLFENVTTLSNQDAYILRVAREYFQEK